MNMVTNKGKAGIAAQPVTLRRWRVMMVVMKSGARTRHVCGHDATIDAGRVSGAVADFKLDTMTITTASGETYKLVGFPAQSRKVQPIWEEWCKANGVAVERDISNEYLDPANINTGQFVALNVSAFSAKDE